MPVLVSVWFASLYVSVWLVSTPHCICSVDFLLPESVNSFLLWSIFPSQGIPPVYQCFLCSGVSFLVWCPGIVLGNIHGTIVWWSDVLVDSSGSRPAYASFLTFWAFDASFSDCPPPTVFLPCVYCLGHSCLVAFRLLWSVRHPLARRCLWCIFAPVAWFCVPARSSVFLGTASGWIFSPVPVASSFALEWSVPSCWRSLPFLVFSTRFAAPLLCVWGAARRSFLGSRMLPISIQVFLLWLGRSGAPISSRRVRAWVYFLFSEYGCRVPLTLHLPLCPGSWQSLLPLGLRQLVWGRFCARLLLCLECGTYSCSMSCHGPWPIMWPCWLGAEWFGGSVLVVLHHLQKL